MDNTSLIASGALILSAILSLFMFYFKSKYSVLKELVRDFTETANLMVKIIEDDKITEDEFKELTKHLKVIILKAQKLLK